MNPVFRSILFLAMIAILASCGIHEDDGPNRLELTPRRVVNRGDTLAISGTMEVPDVPCELIYEINGPWGDAVSYFHLVSRLPEVGSSPATFQFHLVVDSVRQGLYDLTVSIKEKDKSILRGSKTVRFAIDYPRANTPPKFVDSVVLDAHSISNRSYLQLANTTKPRFWPEDSAMAHRDLIDLVLEPDSTWVVIRSPNLVPFDTPSLEPFSTRSTKIGHIEDRSPVGMSALDAENVPMEKDGVNLSLGHSYRVHSDVMDSTSKILFVARFDGVGLYRTIVLHVYDAGWGAPLLEEPYDPMNFLMRKQNR